MGSALEIFVETQKICRFLRLSKIVKSTERIIVETNTG